MRALVGVALVTVVSVVGVQPVSAAAGMCGSAPFSFTAPSGKAGSKLQKLRATALHGGGALPRPATGYALHAIAIEEDGSDGCGVHASFMPLPRSTRVPEFAEGDLRVGACKGGTHRTASANGTDVIIGVRVCTEPGQGEIHGVQVFGGELSADGKSVTAASYTGEALDGSRFASHECKDAGWQPEVRCPAGQVAIGLRASHDGKRYVSLALECAPIAPC